MLIHYFTCADCAERFKEPVQITDDMLPSCPDCGSEDINETCYAQVEYDDARDEARMAEIRAEHAKWYDAMDSAIPEGALFARQAS